MIYFTQKEPEPIAQCEWCKGEIYNDNHVYNGDVICPECAAFVEKPESVIKFIKAYPALFIEYLTEEIYENRDEMLEDFRDWAQELFGKWVRS